MLGVAINSLVGDHGESFWVICNAQCPKADAISTFKPDTGLFRCGQQPGRAKMPAKIRIPKNSFFIASFDAVMEKGKGTVNFSIKVFDKDGQEYGRATANVAARHEDAKFVDFIFDNRTDLEGKSKFVME